MCDILRVRGYATNKPQMDSVLTAPHGVSCGSLTFWTERRCRKSVKANDKGERAGNIGPCLNRKPMHTYSMHSGMQFLYECKCFSCNCGTFMASVSGQEGLCSRKTIVCDRRNGIEWLCGFVICRLVEPWSYTMAFNKSTILILFSEQLI